MKISTTKILLPQKDIHENLKESGYLSLPDLMEELQRRKLLYEQVLLVKEQCSTYHIYEYGIDDDTFSSLEEQETLRMMREFALDTSKQYEESMRQLMEVYAKTNPKFTEKIIRRMKETRHDIPRFDLYGKTEGMKFLRRNFSDDIQKDGVGDFVIVFNLPWPLGKFWYKGGVGRLAEEVEPGEIEWGHFYRECMYEVYGGVDKARGEGLSLDRLNEYSDHLPGVYYYIWTVSVH